MSKETQETVHIRTPLCRHPWRVVAYAEEQNGAEGQLRPSALSTSH